MSSTSELMNLCIWTEFLCVMNLDISVANTDCSTQSCRQCL